MNDLNNWEAIRHALAMGNTSKNDLIDILDSVVTKVLDGEDAKESLVDSVLDFLESEDIEVEEV